MILTAEARRRGDKFKIILHVEVSLGSYMYQAACWKENRQSKKLSIRAVMASFLRVLLTTDQTKHAIVATAKAIVNNPQVI